MRGQGIKVPDRRVLGIGGINAVQCRCRRPGLPRAPRWALAGQKAAGPVVPRCEKKCVAARRDRAKDFK